MNDFRSTSLLFCMQAPPSLFRPLVVVVYLLAIGVAGAQNRQELRFVHSLLQGGTASTFCVKASLQVDTVQVSSAAGLAFVFAIRNDSTASVTLHNVMDRFRITLLNHNDFSYDLVPRQLAMTNCYGPKSPPRFNGYVLEQPMLNGRLLNIDVWNEHEVTIPPNGTFAVRGRITRVRPLDKERTQILVNLPIGKYSLATSVGLVVGARNEFLVSPRSIIRYGP